MEISKLYATLDANLAPLRAGLNAARGLISRAASGISSIGSSLAGGLGMGAGMAAVNATIGMVSAGISAIGNTIGEAASRGSDLGETLSKTQVLLGQNAAGAIKFAEGLQNAGKGQMGDILESLTGSTLAMKQMGVETGKAIDLARQLEERVGDVASQDNIDPKQIRENLQSAFAGEYQILRKYKVFVDAEQLKKSGKPMAEAMAEAFLAQTQRAQGDFDRTRFSSANLGRTATNTFQAALTKLGEAMAPAVQAFQYLRTVLADMFLSIAQSGAFTGVIESIRNSLIAFSILIQTRGQSITSTLAWMAESLASVISTIVDVGTSFDSVVEMLSFGLRSAILPLLDTLGQFSGSIKDLAKNVRDSLDFDMEEMVRKNADRLKKQKEIEDKLKDALKAPEIPPNGAGGPNPAPQLPDAAAARPQDLRRVSLDRLLDDAGNNDKQTSLLQKIADNTAKPGQPGAANVTSKLPGMQLVAGGLIGAI